MPIQSQISAELDPPPGAGELLGWAAGAGAVALGADDGWAVAEAVALGEKLALLLGSSRGGGTGREAGDGAAGTAMPASRSQESDRKDGGEQDRAPSQSHARSSVLCFWPEAAGLDISIRIRRPNRPGFTRNGGALRSPAQPAAQLPA
jgi:hypothetical protein